MGTSRFQREPLLQSVARSAKSGLGPGLPDLRLGRRCLTRPGEKGDTLARQKVSMSEGNGRVHFPYSCSYALVRLRQESLPSDRQPVPGITSLCFDKNMEGIENS